MASGLRWLVILTFLILAGGLVLGMVKRAQPVQNFADCAARGNPIQESYPRVCLTPQGKSFTEPLDTAP